MTGMTAIVLNFNWVLLIVATLWTLSFGVPLFGIWRELKRYNDADAHDREVWSKLPLELDDEAIENQLDELSGETK